MRPRRVGRPQASVGSRESFGVQRPSSRSDRAPEPRERTDCTVVGVERDGTVITDFGPEFRIEAEGVSIVAGTDEGTDRFTELVG